MRRNATILVFVSFILTAAFAAATFGAKAFSGDDEKFFKKAVSGGMMEIQLGQIAEQKGQSAEVKDFGKRLVADHTEANKELASIAQQKGEPIPNKMESKDHKMVEKLSKLSGPDFDKQYMEAMVKDHSTDVSDFLNVGKMTKDPDLHAWATKTAPVLEDHLKQARQIAQKMGIDINKVEEQGLKDAEKPKG